MTRTESIAFIGGGNMAAALIQGLLQRNTTTPERLLVTDVSAETLSVLATRHRIATSSDNLRACASDVIVLAVKPQVFPSLLPQLAPRLGGQSLVISIAAGVPLGAIEAQLPAARVVRAMPNTPALVLAGATALAPGARASAADMVLAREIFASVGEVVEVPESQMDAVTALSGSGPAYVFLLVEALSEAAVQLGLPLETAATLARQTLFGAGQLLHAGTESASELRRKVTSPGGTTAAGVAALEAHGFRASVLACLEAACVRGAELGRDAAAKLGAAE